MTKIIVSYENLKEFVVPIGFTFNLIDCSNNQLKELIIPDGCESVWCYNNQLKELIIPDGCKYVRCWNNQLNKLILPDDCKIVSCWNNQLIKLIIPDGCVEVWADLKSVTVLNKVEDLNLWI